MFLLHDDDYSEIETFVESVEGRRLPDTVLATILFTDIVGSTQQAARPGDRAWADLVERHHAFIGARVAARAAPGEVLVSQTVKDLVAGAGIEFDARGEYELKGVPGAWSLFSVAEVSAHGRTTPGS